MANGHGGYRPGSGRKTAETRTYQATRRAQLEQFVTDDDWQAIVAKAIEQAKAGDYVSRSWLSAYVAGKPPEEVRVGGSDGDAIIVRVEYADADPAEAA